MTRPLRQAHRWIWIVLSLLLPAVFFASLAARGPEPSNPDFVWERWK